MTSWRKANRRRIRRATRGTEPRCIFVDGFDKYGGDGWTMAPGYSVWSLPRPVRHPLDLGGVTIGMVEQPDGSIAIVP